MKINLIDGKAGHRIPKLFVRVSLATGQMRAQDLTAARTANAYEIETNGAKWLGIGAISVTEGHYTDYEECDDDECKHGGIHGSYLVTDIQNEGLNLGSCQLGVRLPITPGTINVYLRKRTWLEKVVSRLYS